ncbi:MULTISPECIES: SLC13 family permease [unclassified Cupriavidus]|uniref:SLC13 family permease n=1 Tax=Cupriavidus sp. H19C3 TaxID=3241603 RepID=UPI003BF84D13
MSQHVLSISVLALMFVVATVLPINMGVLAFVGAFLVGTFVVGMSAKTIFMGFPADLFLTLVGITYLFAVAQKNGTIDWLVRLSVRAVGGRIAAIPWIMFGIAALLTSVGAVSPAAVAIIAPIALGFAARYGINPLLMGLMVVHGAQGGGFSPMSIYGGITNKIVHKAGLPLNEMATAFASLGFNLAVAGGLFCLLGGLKLMRKGSPATHATAATRAGAGVMAMNDPFSARAMAGATVVAHPDDIAGHGGHGSPGATAVSADAAGTLYQYLTVTCLVALAVLTLYFKLDIGFVSLTLALLLTLMAPNLQKQALSQVSWPEIMLIVGVSTYVGVMEKMGTIAYVGDSVAGLTSPLIAALLLCFIGAVVSAFASSTAVLGSLIPLAVPFLQGGDVSAIGFIAAMAVSSTIVDVSPFSTNGALVLANAQGVDRQAFFRKLMVYGALVTLIAPVVLWFLFVVLGA